MHNYKRKLANILANYCDLPVLDGGFYRKIAVAGIILQVFAENLCILAIFPKNCKKHLRFVYLHNKLL